MANSPGWHSEQMSDIKTLLCRSLLCAISVISFIVIYLLLFPRKEILVFPESALAHALLDGLSGVEIGASAHNPFGLQTINVDYTNSSDVIFKRAELQMSGKVARVDVVAEGDSLPFAENSYDFVLSSHVIEHLFDPIAAVEEWLRVVKPGGFVYIIIPHRDRTEQDRELTSVKNFIKRHRKGRAEWAAEAEGSPKRTHHSFWTLETFMMLCRRQGWRVLASQNVDDKVGNGFTIVLQKPFCIVDGLTAIPSEELGYHPSTGLRDIIHSYGGWTGTHGIAHIIFAQTCCLRTFWILVTGVAFIGMSAEVYILLNIYLSFPTEVDVDLAMGTPTFPTVTLCNANAWNRSAAAGTPLQGLIAAYEGTAANTSDYGFNLQMSTGSRVKWAEQWAVLLAPTLTSMDQNGTADLGYTWQKLFLSCSYAGIECDEGNFTALLNPHYGFCYQFNPHGEINSSSPGPRGGLRIVMRVTQREYLPWRLSAGAVVHLGPSGVNPYIDVYGLSAPIGFASNLGVSLIHRRKLPAPYSNCTQNGTMYTMETCIRNCIQKRILQRCGCYIGDSPFGTTRFPTVALPCWDVANKSAAIQHQQQIDGIRGITAAVPQAASHIFIDEMAGQKLQASIQPLECARIATNLTRQCPVLYRGSTLQINIYYDRLAVQTKEELSAYTVYQLLSEVGATLGLWMGMSIACILEWLIFLWMLLRWCMFPPRKVRIDPQYDYFAELKRRGAATDEPEIGEGDSAVPTTKHTLP